VGHPDVDALSGNGEGTAGADPPLDAHRFGCRGRWWSGGAGIADASLFGGGQRVRQAAHQDTVLDQLQQAAVETYGQAPAGVVVADGVLPAGEADQAGGVDGAVDLDRVAGLTRGDGWRAVRLR
jgi:hypothetical protein